MDLITIVNAVAPSYETIRTEITELRISYPTKTNQELAEIYGNRLRKKYTSVGVASSLPSVIPGLGTAAQIAVEASTISADLALMLRWMAANCYGIALIYDKDITNDFNQEFVKILGIWCGVIKAAQQVTTRILTKAAVVQFNKNVSGKILQKINQKVGFTLLTKYGTKRGGIALGKLIPFGIGAAIAGTFNYITMNSFKKSAIEYFGADEDAEYVMFEETE
jgi:hypothetical protein